MGCHRPLPLNIPPQLNSLSGWRREVPLNNRHLLAAISLPTTRSAAAVKLTEFRLRLRVTVPGIAPQLISHPDQSS